MRIGIESISLSFRYNNSVNINDSSRKSIRIVPIGIIPKGAIYGENIH